MTARRMSSKLFLLATAMLAIGQPSAFAQAPAAATKEPSFEVAAIKPNKTDNGRWKMEFTTNGLTAMGVSLQYVIRDAYGIYDDRRWSGGPPWLDSEKFDIEAKFDTTEFANPTLEQRQAMLQKLLAERFKLVIHHESRIFPLYALVTAKNGPKFQASKPESIVHSGADGHAMCFIPRGRPGYTAFQGCSMEDFVSNLTSDLDDVGRTVVDKTGLTGRYDFELRWATDNPATPDSSAPSIFTAVQDQLGLKLESIRGPLDTIVIDHAERPTDN